MDVSSINSLLSPTEVRLLNLLAHGTAKADIAKQMKIAPVTMRYYLSHAKYKLGANPRARDNAHVIYLAMKAGIVV